MAALLNSGRLVRFLILVAALPLLAEEPIRLTLEQASTRSGIDFAPAHEGKHVIVSGQVTNAPLWSLDEYYLPIRDKGEFGLVLYGPLSRFQGLKPGDLIDVRGRLVKRYGLPVVLPEEITKTGNQPVPAPPRLKIGEVASLRYLGLVVSTEGVVSGSVTESNGSEVVSLADRSGTVAVLLPRTAKDPSKGRSRFRVGDRLQANGLAIQYSPAPPYDRSFQLLVFDPEGLVLLERGWLIPPLLLLTALLGVVFVLSIWWIREHRMASQRRTLRMLNSLGEEIISAGSPAEILRKMSSVVTGVTHATGVRLYVYNRKTKSLEQITQQWETRVPPIRVDLPREGLATGAALCFRNRILINVPDTRRSPLLKLTQKTDFPRSVMFVPMFAQDELVGVLQFDSTDKLRYFSKEEQAAAQHLANQVGASLKLQEQQSIREALFRSEKLAATGLLISGVANELSAPLRTIVRISSALAAQADPSLPLRDLRILAAEGQRAAEIVMRLVSFANTDDARPKMVEVNGLLSSLLQFREHEWRTVGIKLDARLSPDPVYVLGSQGQLEQVFLNLLIHAEQSLTEAADKSVIITSAVLAKRLTVEISYRSRSGDEPALDPFAEGTTTDSAGLGLGVSRGILKSHGGEIQFQRPSNTMARFHVELPVAIGKEPAQYQRSASEVREAAGPMTVLLVEPEASIRHQIVNLLGARKHRVVPHKSAEEASDVAKRLRFDAVFCSAHLPGMTWVEFYERIREQVGAFVLVTEGNDAELAQTFRDGEGYLLSKPIQQGEVERLLRAIELRQRAAPQRP